MSAYDSDSDASFHSFNEDDSTDKPVPTHPPPQTQPSNQNPPQKPVIERFSPEEEASLLAESQTLKTAGNSQFTSASFSSAIQTYDKALASCPNYLDFELAVLRSNIAACHLKLQEWKECIESAEKGIEGLERLEPLPIPPRSKARGKEEEQQNDADGVEEIDDEAEARIEALKSSGHTLTEVRNLQIKLLLRRAKARTELDGWANLQGADEDYRILLSPTMLPCLTSTDRTAVARNARDLTPKLNAAKEREMGEMMDKLKGLGNSILKPFGMSTENFQFVKDEKTGGYSMNFNQNPGKGS